MDDRGASAPGRPERHIHHRVRAVFGEATLILAPLLAGAGVSGFALVHLLRDRFPDLSEEQITIPSAAAHRLRQG